MSATLAAWLILILGFALPLGHVAASPASGPWTPRPGARCPFGPRAGWVVIVLLLGPFGWLIYMHARRRRGAAGRASGARASGGRRSSS